VYLSKLPGIAAFGVPRLCHTKFQNPTIEDWSYKEEDEEEDDETIKNIVLWFFWR